LKVIPGTRFFVAVALLSVCLRAGGQDLPTLPGTERWDFPADIAAEQHRELLRYFEARIGEAARRRNTFWQGSDWKQVVTGNRAELRRMIGAHDSFLSPKPQTRQIAETPAFTISLVNWPILRLAGVYSELRNS
jgi:hypothetical protein